MLAGIVGPIVESPGASSLPEIAAHVDSALPAAFDLDTAGIEALVAAAIDWMAAAGEAGFGSLSFWRGGTDLDPGTGRDVLVVVLGRRAASLSQDAPDIPARLAEAVRALGGTFVPASAPPGTQRLRIAVPHAFSPEAAPGRTWGAAFERRRILFVRDILFERERLARSLAGVGLDAAFETDLDRALATAREAGLAGRPFDLVLLCRRLSAGRIDEAVDALRALPCGANLRIVVTSATPEDARNPAIDGTIPRHGPWRRLLPVLFDLLRRPRGDAASPPHAEVPSFAGHHIIIAEDVSMNRALLQAMLAPTGVTYEVAADGAEAVEAMRRRPADLVLMDIQMPVMDGLEATRRIRAISQGVKVIALTANAREADRETYLAAGMNGYLAKPIRVDDLYAVLRRELG
jgi:CheY-like chemotaxis protein